VWKEKVKKKVKNTRPVPRRDFEDVQDRCHNTTEIMKSSIDLVYPVMISSIK